MINKLYSYSPLILVFCFCIIGFYLRLSGIFGNHSFWADEAFISSVARDIFNGKADLSLPSRILGPNYQTLQVFTVFFSFILFGVSEFSARLPSVIWGTLGILFAYLVARRIAGPGAGVIASFFYTFSQLNIANATQAKPYAAQQTLLLLFLYILLFLEKKKKRMTTILLHILLLIILTIATLYHALALLYWVIYCVWLILSYRSVLFYRLQNIKTIAILVAGFLFFLFPLHGYSALIKFFIPSDGKFIFMANNISYVNELFLRQYLLITLTAIFGLIFTLKTKYHKITVALCVWLGALIFLWTFRYTYHNIRYLVPLFGLLIVFFGVFWGQVFDTFWKKKSWIMVLLLMSLLFFSGYKIVRKPATYYTPNADFYGDVQIANYREAFRFINDTYAKREDVVFYNNVFDSERWYSQKKSTALFQKFVTRPKQDTFYKVTVYGSLADFKKQMNRYPKGILLVEDWESFLPEDIKQYAKKNMKRELRVEGLPEAKGDNWPLEIYSWGL